MNPSIRILLVEDNPGDARLIREMLRDQPEFELTWASDLKGGVTCAARVVRVGQPTTWRLSGRITCQGQPLGGARISLSESLVTYADADGDYTAVGLTNGQYQLHPGMGHYTFTPSSRFVVISN